MIVNIPDNWLPTNENINALPRPLRDFIMRLHANTDPAGELRRAMVAEMERDALRKMMEWQPIETAPKDGSWLIAYNPMTGPYGTCYRDGHFPFYGWAPQTIGFGIWYPTPTHWQPFPEAPSERG